MGMILRIASSRIVGQGDIVGRSGYFSLNLSANSVMRGRLDARRTLKSLVADLRKKTDLNNGMLTYRRKKTGQLLSIRWEKCMQDIVDKYPGNYSTYLLPIIIHIRKDERLQYKNSICLVNRRLKEIGKKLGLVHPLTMYVARHSWASVARGKHIPLSVISEGMGHDSEKTTLIYLAALDTTVIDKANMVVLREFL